jgi:Cdc6-like AAA superfamily ATPase
MKSVASTVKSKSKPLPKSTVSAINYNQVLERETIAVEIANALDAFYEKKNDFMIKRGIYIYGNPGVGKTEFVVQLLKTLNYDMVRYDAGDIRNKSVIDLITNHNMSEHSVLSMFQKNPKRIAIVMDEIDGMNNGDKGGINALIKLMRPKKTKKQRLEDVTMNPIICIGNYHMDKKIRELMKVCTTFELKTPTLDQVSVILESTLISKNAALHKTLARFIQGDLRKIEIISGIFNKHSGTGSTYESDKHNVALIQTIFQSKANNEDSKTIVKKLINSPCRLNEHSAMMNETDRTIVGLLWHENVVDVLSKQPNQMDAFRFYKDALDNICLADYIDRITFQKQIWQFNEMSSLIKTFYTNKLYHERFETRPKFNPSEVRFTKVLTKYSTEYNNTLFIQMMCQKFGMDKKDLFAFFLSVFAVKNDTNGEDASDKKISDIIEEFEITKLDIQRMHRYLNKCTCPSEMMNDEPDDEPDSW